MSKPHLFIFGLGFSAAELARRSLNDGWTVSGTSRTPEKCALHKKHGINAFPFDGTRPLKDADTVLASVTHLLVSIPPGAEADPVLAHHREALAALTNLQWAGYLSTTGVYGDKNGEWVDENTPCAPTSERGRRRQMAEESWMTMHREYGMPMHIFRLAGIYGPGRNQLETIKSGKARRIIKAGQVFSRIHRDDIATVLQASVKTPDPGAIYNVCDDEAAPPQDVISFAAHLLNTDEPPVLQFKDAELSPMARSFYAENKRVRNDRIKKELGIGLAYPTYREGLRALLNTTI